MNSSRSAFKKRSIESTGPDVNSIDSNIEPSSTKKAKHIDQASSVLEKRLPLKNLTTKAQSAFKSPLLNRNKVVVSQTANSKNESLADTEKSIGQLENQLSEIDREINGMEMQGIDLNELDNIIDKLHVYNEIKDIAQIVMGKIAELKCITIKKVHQDYDADFTD
jgi:hypothetical protein